VTLTSDSTRADDRCRRLSTASLKRVVEPDLEFAWETLGPGQVIADELLSTAGLDVSLDREQRARQSREEVASMLQNGLRFEAILNAAFSLQIAEIYDARDPRVAYMLHEIGEETRHSRAFARLIEELGPNARDPFQRRFPKAMRKRIVRSLFSNPALLTVFVLAGEEIPDMLQRIAADHPETDPLLAGVNRYHRMEEARHLAFARTVLPELWDRADRSERWRVRHFAPLAIRTLWDELVHPGVYRAVGLPGWKTWFAANRTPERVALRHEGTRPILATLLDLGIVRRGRVPRAWRSLCGVDRRGEPVS
jgi:hypothetical protein